jgi:hypothetical protein
MSPTSEVKKPLATVPGKKEIDLDQDDQRRQIENNIAVHNSLQRCWRMPIV